MRLQAQTQGIYLFIAEGWYSCLLSMLRLLVSMAWRYTSGALFADVFFFGGGGGGLIGPSLIIHECVLMCLREVLTIWKISADGRTSLALGALQHCLSARALEIHRGVGLCFGRF